MGVEAPKVVVEVGRSRGAKQTQASRKIVLNAKKGRQRKVN